MGGKKAGRSYVEGLRACSQLVLARVKGGLDERGRGVFVDLEVNKWRLRHSIGPALQENPEHLPPPSGICVLPST